MHWRTALIVLCAAAAAAALCPPSARAQAYLDESLTAQEMIDQAAVLREQGRIADAITLLGDVVAQHPEKLLPIGEGLYADTRVRVRQIVADDAALLEAYRQTNAASAQRALELALDGGPDAMALQTVLRDYGLTRSGRDAGLALAAMNLERGDGAAARSVLDEIAEHPDHESRAGDYHRAAAVAAVLLGERQAFDVHRLAAERAGSTDLAMLDALAAHLLQAQASPAVEPLPRSDKPLWTHQFYEFPEDTANPQIRQMRGNAANSTTGLQAGYTTIPKPSGDMIFLNSGEALDAVDADSGRLLWRYESAVADVPEDDNPQRAMIIRMQMMRASGDLREAAVSGRRVYAVMGKSARFRHGAMAHSAGQGSELVSIQRETGERVWSVLPGNLDDSTAASSFIGTPIVAFGRVYTMLSRQPGGNAEDTFVVCVDAESGELRWMRHVGGQSQPRTGLAKPGSLMLLSGSRVYVCDAVSIVSCLDARTGLTYWSRLMDVNQPNLLDARRIARSNQQRDLGELVRVEAGLVAPIAPDEASGVLLDPETGEVKRVLRGWPVDASLMPLGSDVLVVGEQIMRLDGRTLDSVWKQSLGPGEQDKRVLGRGAVAGDAVVLPTRNGIKVIDPQTGKVRREIDSVKGGNMAWRQGVLLVADDERLMAIDDWDDARRRLLARATDRLADPNAGLAMAYLALRQNDDEAVIEGVDQAILAADMSAAADAVAGTAAQRRVFRSIRSYTDQKMGGNDRLRQALFDRLATLTSGPADEVAYHLALGAFLSEKAVGQPDQAVAHYQAILASPDLADQVFDQEGYRRQAGLEARRRLQKLLTEHGTSIYRRFDELAATDLQQLLASNADARQLIALARGYPLAAASATAHLRAAQLLAEDGDPAGAATQFRLAYEQARDEAARVEAASSLAAHYEAIGQPRRGLRWLQRIERDLPGAMLNRNGIATDAASWGAELATMPDTRAALPMISPQINEVIHLPGRMVPIRGSSEHAISSARFLTIDHGTLRLHAGASGEPLWSRATDSMDAFALGVTAEQVLLYSTQRGELTAINGRTGELDWPVRHVTSLLREVTEEDRLPEDRNRVAPELLELLTPGNQNRRAADILADPDRPIEKVQVMASESVVVVADVAGRVVGLDRYTGSVLWRLRSPIDELSGMTIGEDAVALHGNSYAADSAHAGRLLVLDLVTGRPRMPTLHLGAALPRWSAFTGRNKLVLIDLAGVVAYDLNNAQVAWRTNPSTLPLIGDAWAGDQTVIVPDNGGVAHLIDTETGQVRQRISAEAQRRSPPSDATLTEGQTFLLSAGSVVALNKEWRVVWRDAADPDRKFFVRHWVGQSHVAVLSLVPARPTDAQREPHAWLFFFERANGRLVTQYRLSEALGRIDSDASALIDHALLLSTEEGVVALPMSPP